MQLHLLFSNSYNSIWNIKRDIWACKCNRVKKGRINETGSINLEGDLTAYLDVDVAYSNLNIKVGKEFLAQTNNENIQCKQDGNRLKIKEKI